jgi:hypothetical protein
MGVTPSTAQRRALGVAVFASLALLVGGFAFVAQEFGVRSAATLSLLLALPLVIAVHLCRRWPAGRSRELAYLAILFGVASVGGTFVVRVWYADGLDGDHAKDVQWTAFERRLRRDPAFRDVQVHKSERKNIHWASGTVESQADLARLRSLAAECGIDGPLDGPYAQSVSLTVRRQLGG